MLACLFDEGTCISDSSFNNILLLRCSGSDLQVRTFLCNIGRSSEGYHWAGVQTAGLFIDREKVLFNVGDTKADFMDLLTKSGYDTSKFEDVLEIRTIKRNLKVNIAYTSLPHTTNSIPLCQYSNNIWQLDGRKIVLAPKGRTKVQINRDNNRVRPRDDLLMDFNGGLYAGKLQRKQTDGKSTFAYTDHRGYFQEFTHNEKKLYIRKTKKVKK